LSRNSFADFLTELAQTEIAQGLAVKHGLHWPAAQEDLLTLAQRIRSRAAPPQKKKAEPASLNEVRIFIDGASRGNPGPAAAAAIIQTAGGEDLVEKSRSLGTATNNIAEYQALLLALQTAVELGAGRLLIHSDSDLLVEQMNGRYKVKNPAIRELFDKAKNLCRNFEHVKIVHVPRERNAAADRLANEELDRTGK